MRLENSFTVPASTDAAWQALLDVPRVAPCLPGAALTDFDGEEFSGTVKVRVGPMTMTYKGQGRFVERDDEAHQAVITASGRESRGQGSAAATITATLRPDGENAAATRVDVVTDLDIAGRAAQLGRGMLAEVSARLIDQFAANLAATLGGGASANGAAPPASAEAAEVVETPAAESPAADGDDRPPPADRAPEVPPREAEPLDLLALTGTSALARRAAPYLAAFVAGLLVARLLGRRRD